MGSCSYDTPDFSNICDNAVGDIYQITGVCQSFAFSGDLCKNISPNEWVFYDQGSSCGYNDCDGGYSGLGSPICCDGQGCCGILGFDPRCIRTSFLGNPTICAIQDLQCNITNPNLCWDSANHQNTCNPENRSITTPSSQDALLGYCTGADLEPTDVTWLNRWNGSEIINGNTYDQPCVYAVNRNLFNTPTTPLICNNFNLEGLPISSSGFTYVQNLLTEAYNKYKSQGFILGTNPGSQGFNQFQNTLLNICLQTPGVCSDVLSNAASGLTMQNLLDLPTSAEIFGCYLPQAEYQTYVDQYQIGIPCVPTCNRSNVIPLVANDGITKLKCSSNICLMDNISVNLINSQVEGNLQFSQICQGCSSDNPNISASCSCILSDTTLDVVNSAINGQINFSQNCTGSIQCISTDSAGNKVQTPCSSSGTSGTSPYQQEINLQENATAIANSQGNLVLIFGIILLIVLIVVIIFILTRKKL
jgi:hypothetical protein